jgi:hypothetical protein
VANAGHEEAPGRHEQAAGAFMNINFVVYVMFSCPSNQKWSRQGAFWKRTPREAKVSISITAPGPSRTSKKAEGRERCAHPSTHPAREPLQASDANSQNSVCVRRFVQPHGPFDSSLNSHDPSKNPNVKKDTCERGRYQDSDERIKRKTASKHSIHIVP